MVATPKQHLHELVEQLTDEEAQRLSLLVRSEQLSSTVTAPRPLTFSDIVLAEPIMPDDETADELIATVRQWRREGGYA